MAEGEKVRYLQASFTPSDFKKISIYFAENEIENKRQWMRDLVYKAVGIEGDIHDGNISKSTDK